MPHHCTMCGKPTEEVFNIPWLGKFYRCEDGHPEVRDTEGTRTTPDMESMERMRDCRWFAEKFARKKRSRVGEGAAPSNA
jgi:hypothetical protein